MKTSVLFAIVITFILSGCGDAGSTGKAVDNESAGVGQTVSTPEDLNNSGIPPIPQLPE